MLEVEATGDAIHIEQFSHQVETWLATALHAGQVHLAQGHTAGRDELFAKGAAAAHPVPGTAQIGEQALLLALGEISPAPA